MEITYLQLLEAARGGFIEKIKAFNIAGKVELGFWLLDIQEEFGKVLKDYNSVAEKVEAEYTDYINKLENGTKQVYNGGYVFKSKEKEQQFSADTTKLLERKIEFKADKIAYSLVKDEIKDITVLGFIRPLLDRNN